MKRHFSSQPRGKAYLSLFFEEGREKVEKEGRVVMFSFEDFVIVLYRVFLFQIFFYPIIYLIPLDSCTFTPPLFHYS